MNQFEHFENIETKLIQIARTPSADWLKQLTIMKCEECGQETLFSICIDCLEEMPNE